MAACPMCQIRKTLKKAMDEIDSLPEVNSALYDDAVTAAYQALETAYYIHQHYCDEQERATDCPPDCRLCDNGADDAVPCPDD